MGGSVAITQHICRLVRTLVDSQGSLATKAVRSGVWVVIGRAVGRLLTFIRTIVLARLLAPDDFGLFAIALLGLHLLDTLSQTGFDAALIHRRDDATAPYLDTAWVVQVGRAAALALALALCAGPIATFFKEPAAGPLLRLVALGVLLGGFTNIGVLYLRKDLEFRRQTVFQLSTVFADAAVSIAAAVVLRSAWALAWGFVAAQGTRTVVSFAIHPYRPKLRFDRGQAGELFGFGKWVFSTRVLNFLVESVDTGVVGKLLDAASLGLFNMASRLSATAATEITHVVSQVTFPTLAKVREDRDRLRTVASRTLSLVSLVSLPLAGGLFVLAPEVVRTLLGRQWEAMIPALQLLLISGAVRSLTANFGPLFLAAGRPDIQTKVSLLNLLILGVTLVPLVGSFGILGAVYARLLTLATQFYAWPQFLRLAGIRAREVVKILAPPAAATALAMGAILILRGGIASAGVGALAVLLATGISLYLVVVWAADRLTGSYHQHNLQRIVQLLGDPDDGLPRDT